MANNGNDGSNRSDSGSNIGAYDFKRIVEDLELASAIGGSNPKNYQIWYHRRSLLELSFIRLKTLLEGQEENSVGNENDKNDGGFDGMKLARDELEYIETVIKEDTKNYHVSFQQYMLTHIFTLTLLYR